MAKFKEALERGKKARRQQEEPVGGAEMGKRDGPMADFSDQAKAWLNDVVIASLEAAKADVAGEVTVDIDTAPRRQVKALTPSIRFQIYRKRELEKTPRRTYTVNVKVSGAVSVSSPGMVTKDVGNMGDRSDLRVRTERGRN